jgi:hypothetical protein
MSLRWCESPDNLARIAALPADQAPTAIIGCPHHHESLRMLAKRYGDHQKTVAKWRKRSPVADLPAGPKEPRSMVLSIEDEAIIIAFRRHTLLPLDDRRHALPPAIPHLTRSSLHRCLQRHGISRLPEPDRRQTRQEEVQNLSDRLLPYRHRRSPNRGRQAPSLRRHRPNLEVRLRRVARDGDDAFLRHLIAAVPYKIHTVLSDHGIHFTTPGGGGSIVNEIKEAIARGELFRHMLSSSFARKTTSITD